MLRPLFDRSMMKKKAGMTDLRKKLWRLSQAGKARTICFGFDLDQPVAKIIL